MATLRRLLIVAALLGSILGGYVFSSKAVSHTAPARPAIACGAVLSGCE